MANVNALCFQLDTAACANPSNKGTIIEIPECQVCPLAKKTFQELRAASFQEKSFPYAVVYIQCKNGSTFCDGPAAIRWLEKSFTNPKTGETAKKVYLFAQGIMQLPFRHIASCSGPLTTDMKEAGLAFSREYSKEIHACRIAFLQKGIFNMHGKDLLPLFERTLQENPKETAALLRLGLLYCIGTTTVQKDFQKATAYFTRALQLEPAAASTIYLVAEAYLDGTLGALKDAKQASAFLELSLEYNPTHIGTLTTLGFLLYTGRDGVPQNWGRAEKLLSRLVVLDKKNSAALVTLSEMYRIGGFGITQKTEKANALLKRALQEVPHNEEVLHCCTASQLLHGGNGASQNREKARAIFEEVLKKNPNNRCAQESLKSHELAPPAQTIELPNVPLCESTQGQDAKLSH